MSGRWYPLVVLAAVLLLAGCTDAPAPRGSTSAGGSPSRPPALGGPTPVAHPAPTRPMNGLERPVAERLARQVRRQGLSLAYLDCPAWDGTVPARMTCSAYVDGLVARVRVHLRAAVEGKAVGFDARLAEGVVATRRLEETLRAQGGRDPDCGDRPAYPARAGTRIVCAVTRDGRRGYVVATVSGRSGRVMIEAYPG